ncbi:MAG: hypothetical protein KIT09_04970 [Bryobacteraceae bacterium]|nr:hypothetical protein [Bryobacteraceae bacterium]
MVTRHWAIAAVIGLLSVLSYGQPAPEVSGAGKEYHVAPGQDLQKTLDLLKPGDRVFLDPEGVWEGTYTLRRQPLGAAPIEITGWKDAPLPPGARVTPEATLATLKRSSPGGPVVRTDPEAHGYVLRGLRILGEGIRLFSLVELGDMTTSRIEDQPQNLTIDHCFISGDPAMGARRGIALNSGATVIRNSYITQIKDDVDNQAILGVNGPGPYRIENNTLEAACENIMFGGAPSRIEGLNPTGIFIKGNLIRKPLEWRAERREDGKPKWSYKNLLELKRGVQVEIVNNRFENSWAGSQRGFAFVFTVRTEGRGNAPANPWAAIRDVVVRDNEIYNVGAGVNILGKDNNRGFSGIVKGVTIENNFFWINPRFGADVVFQILTGAEDIAIRGNTAVFLEESKAPRAIVLDGPPQTPPRNPSFECTEPIRKLIVERNILAGDVFARGLPPGDRPLQVFSRDSEVRDNVFIPGAGAPARNRKAKLDRVGFANFPEDLRVPEGAFKDYGAK